MDAAVLRAVAGDLAGAAHAARDRGRPLRPQRQPDLRRLTRSPSRPSCSPATPTVAWRPPPLDGARHGPVLGQIPPTYTAHPPDPHRRRPSNTSPPASARTPTTTARQRGAAMTYDEIIAYTLDQLARISGDGGGRLTHVQAVLPAPSPFCSRICEGSTRRWQDEPEAMRALLVEHDAILREVIDKHHGHLFKHTGDGVAAVFASAADAVTAAVDAQARLAGVLPVRMGLHTGEAELRDGDYFGSTLNRCARLMGVAHGGQIVCSEATIELVRDRDDLRDLGEHRLRDLTRAEQVWRVRGRWNRCTTRPMSCAGGGGDRHLVRTVGSTGRRCSRRCDPEIPDILMA